MKALTLLLAVCSAAIGQDYAALVRTFADTLIENGRDSYGPEKTPLWCGVLDVKTLRATADAKAVPATPGVRANDRAIGGANLYHDVVTLRVFLALSKATGDAKYAAAVNDYVKAYLARGTSEQTGLIAWGEHLYYDVHRDAVAAERNYHELLEWTAPWELLWSADAARTQRAIEGLQYHFFNADPAKGQWLFNRHAYWAKADFQKLGPSQPWIKHSGLYAHAFAVHYAHTQDARMLEWARAIGSLYWERRNPKTGLTLGCIGDKRETSQQSTLGNTSQLCYYLLKAHHACGKLPDLRDHALVMLKALDKHGWNGSGYVEALNLDGTPVGKPENPWVFAYGGGSGLLRFGRIAAYAARAEKNAECLAIARRAADVMAATAIPPRFTPEEVGFAANLALDVHELTGEQKYLDDAVRYAKAGVDKLWAGGLIRRMPGDGFYEAKLGAGDLLMAWLRLGTRQGKAVEADWSF